MQPVTAPSQAPRTLTDPWSIVKGGLSFGIAYSLPFIVFVFSPSIEVLTDETTSGFIFPILAIIGIFAGGALFGLTTARAVASEAHRRAAIVGGLALPVLMFAGFAVAIQGESVQLGLSTHGLFTLVFPLMTAAVLLAVAMLLGWTLGVKRPFLRALPAAALAWAAYMLAIFLVNKLFHWQVGTGDRAMVKVAMVGDLIAAIIGGAAWIASLRRFA